MVAPLAQRPDALPLEPRPKRSPFYLWGQVVQVKLDRRGRPKGLVLATAGKEHRIKLPKSVRSQLDPTHLVGGWLTCRGRRKGDRRGREILKAEWVSPGIIDVNLSQPIQPPPPPKPGSCPPGGQLLVCQKANCRQRGADRLCRWLEGELAARGLGEQVKLRPSGCLKACKQGPAVAAVVKAADKAERSRKPTYYGSLDKRGAKKMLDRHFG